VAYACRLMKKQTIIAFTVFSLMVALVSSFRIHDSYSGERKILALLDGDASVDIERLTTMHQQRRLECSDAEVLRYLKDAMMKHPHQTLGVGGYTYAGCFKFKGGGTFEGLMSISTNGFDLSVGSYANAEGISTHSIPLMRPVPDKVKQIFDFFDEPWQQAAGVVLILEPGKPPRREHDESLVAK
jgi:hypothetical protein